ncbi:MAG: hypothetical protein NTX22_11815 [Ignavibacteriales bacterium]|nr:hypothetical protein [Ignavibacteriales bacterium]
MTEQNKNIISLNGNWQFIKDAEEKLVLNDINKKLDSDFNFAEMEIPQNWQLAGLDNFNGAIWFLKHFDLPEPKDGIKILKFFGVDYFADVWLNGNYLGNHEGYFQPFYFNITHTVQTTDNLLIVKVTSPLELPGIVWPNRKKLIKGIFNHHDCRPGGWDLKHGQDKNTGGIWNDVAIEIGAGIFIDHVKIDTKLNQGKDKTDVKIIVKYESSFNSSLTDFVDLNIASPFGEELQNKNLVDFKPGKNKFELVIEILQPELWWSWDLGSQKLYQLKISSTLFAEKHFTFGIREVHLDEQNVFHLNGEKLFLRGTNLIPTQWLSELTTEKIKFIIDLMKEANINIVRVHAHINRAEFYDECDKQGILVWQDFPLQWTYDESKEFAANAVSQIKDMVNQYYNHPSICFWCCHNEPGEQINSLDSLLYKAVQSEDQTRIIRKASNYEEHPYDGWYWGNKEHFAAAPMGPLVTEFGAQAVPQIQSLQKFLSEDEIYKPDWLKWKYHNFQYEQTFNIAGIEPGNNVNEFIENSQNYQAELIQTAVDFYRRKKFNGINGIFQFMFIDCWSSISWSVIDYYGNKKKGFDSLKNAYQPIYVSVRMRQKKYFLDSKLNFDLWIINDLIESFQNISLQIFFDETVIHQIDYIKLAANDIQFIDWGKLKIKIPYETEIGEHQIKFELIDNAVGKIISVNSSRMEIVSKVAIEFVNVDVMEGKE